MIIDERGDINILKAFMRHHMAPVAPYSSHRKEDGPVQLFSESKGLITPFKPINRLILGPLKIRASRSSESVRHKHPVFFQ
jgi:hypothetical protein